MVTFVWEVNGLTSKDGVDAYRIWLEMYLEWSLYLQIFHSLRRSLSIQNGKLSGQKMNPKMRGLISCLRQNTFIFRGVGALDFRIGYRDLQAPSARFSAFKIWDKMRVHCYPQIGESAYCRILIRLGLRLGLGRSTVKIQQQKGFKPVRYLLSINMFAVKEARDKFVDVWMPFRVESFFNVQETGYFWSLSADTEKNNLFKGKKRRTCCLDRLANYKPGSVQLKPQCS